MRLVRLWILFGLFESLSKACAFGGKHQYKAETKCIARNPANRSSFNLNGPGLIGHMDERLKFQPVCEVNVRFCPTAGRGDIQNGCLPCDFA